MQVSNFAGKRVGTIDAFELGKCLLGAIGPARHGPHRRRLAHPAEFREDRALGFADARVDARERHVAAEDRLSLALEAGAECISQGTDCRNHQNAQR